MDSHADKARRPLDSRPIAPSLFAHFVLRTANKKALVAWYCTVLAARPIFENDYISFISYDDEHHRVAFIEQPNLEKPAERAWGLAHVAYTFADLGQLLSTYRRLKGAGIVPVRTINHGPTVSMYYRDPDGNQVELQVDAFATKAEAADFLGTEAFAQNPIGVLFDADRMLADYEAGVDERELLRRP
ncbi:MAG: VOC family protein [Proteobacteria bacterium]|nr:VOC family protein [Pseudomonadota bacterium]